jgi:hypothetical protein
MQGKRVLTKIVLPFVYTIFSLLALSLVYAPLTVVGLAGYNATFVKDIVVIDKVDLSTRLSVPYCTHAVPPTSATFIPFSQLSVSLQRLLRIIFERIFPQSFRF